MKKLDEMAMAKATAAMGAGAYVVCAIGVVVLPKIVMWVISTWFHGVKLTVSVGTIYPIPFLVGLVSFTAISWIWGFGLAFLYNKWRKRK